MDLWCITHCGASPQLERRVPELGNHRLGADESLWLATYHWFPAYLDLMTTVAKLARCKQQLEGMASMMTHSKLSRQKPSNQATHLRSFLWFELQNKRSLYISVFGYSPYMTWRNLSCTT